LNTLFRLAALSSRFQDDMTFHLGSAILPRRGRAAPFSRVPDGYFNVKTVSDDRRRRLRK
jgi:hypothetical protein